MARVAVRVVTAMSERTDYAEDMEMFGGGDGGKVFATFANDYYVTDLTLTPEQARAMFNALSELNDKESTQ